MPRVQWASGAIHCELADYMQPWPPVRRQWPWPPQLQTLPPPPPLRHQQPQPRLQCPAHHLAKSEPSGELMGDEDLGQEQRYQKMQ